MAPSKQLADSQRALINRHLLGPNAPSSNKIAALDAACTGGKLEDVQWLVGWCGITREEVQACENKALVSACENGHKNIAEWLVDHYNLAAEDARSDDNAALIGASINGHREVAQWLVDHFNLTAEEVLDAEDIVRGAGFREEADWLESIAPQQ